MRTWLTGTALAAAMLLTAGCVTIQDAPAGAYAVGTSYSVTLGREWSDATAAQLNRSPKVRLLTVDGPLLNRLYLSEALAPGDFIVRRTTKERPTPTYRAGSSPTELVEFVADSVSALEFQRVETAGLRPAKFGGSDALRFDIAAQTKEGLEIAGAAEVAEIAGKLHVILYLAPKEHYFAATLTEVESVMGSVKRGA